ncbi:hypothetical protein ACFYW8_34650 [Streptomyces sp. NPDC002742]|uniref:hypothetical protein n=1 Tax=Streptomyces sp. NPDC002742 TaxID=3364663 RepID=UPI00368350BD
MTAVTARTFRVEGLASRLATSVWDADVEGLVSASFVRNQIKLRVPEADFNVRLRGDGPDRLTLTFEAVFRECGQARRAGGTWWDTWEVVAEPAERAGRVLVEQVLAARRRFAVLLADARREAA